MPAHLAWVSWKVLDILYICFAKWKGSEVLHWVCPEKARDGGQACTNFARTFWKRSDVWSQVCEKRCWLSGLYQSAYSCKFPSVAVDRWIMPLPIAHSAAGLAGYLAFSFVQYCSEESRNHWFFLCYHNKYQQCLGDSCRNPFCRNSLVCDLRL